MRRKDLEWCKKLASAKEGECLATEYKNNKVKILWRCKEGHQWEANPDHIQQGQWCPTCGKGEKRDLRWCQDLANQMGGACLATEYKNNKVKILWRCKEGHQWEAIPNSVQQGHWCPTCVGVVAQHDLKWCQELARQKEGFCLSEEYINIETHLLWRCKENHQWKAVPNSIQQGRWCPSCSGQNSRFEQEVFSFVKYLEPTAQSKVRKLLRNSRFELDIWIPEKRIGIECDGTFWHKSKWAVVHGIPEKEKLKNQQCLEARIHLFRVLEEDWTKSRYVEQDRLKDLLNLI